MRRIVIATAAICAAFFVPLSGRSSDTQLEQANLAWERGDYVSALTIYGALLDSPEADRVFEAVALQTGELYQTREITRDGAAPQFSPDGQYITYESGALLNKKITVLRANASLERVVELPGWGAAFAPDSSRIAYLKLASTSHKLRDAQAALEKAPSSERQQRQTALTRLLAQESRIAVYEIAGGRETTVETGDIGPTGVRIGASNAIVFTGLDAAGGSHVCLARVGNATTPLVGGDGDKALGAVNANGSAVLYTVRPRTGRGGGRGGRSETEQSGTQPRPEAGRPETESESERQREGGSGRGGPREGTGTFGVVVLPEGRVVSATGSAPVFSRDGSALAYVSRQEADLRLLTSPATDPSSSTLVRGGTERIDAPAFAPDRGRLAFQLMPREDWEISLIGSDGKSELRITREIQHDLQPQFLSANRILAVMGEGRHRRSYLYELPSGKRTRLFHNNTVRTIAPEYAWIPDPSGTRILILAERDGDTVSPERGVYLVDLTKRISLDDLKRRVAANLEAEKSLRAKAEQLFAPIADAVRKVVAEASIDRVFAYEERLFGFDSKHITRPGNKLASEYLYDTYKSLGYEPEYQWFSPRNALGGQTANVIATLKGTVNPELVYVVSSHYDSTAAGPGADDDTSGTAALLETARMMAGHPQPATIVFASFTGEEAGLLGSREFVRRAVESKMRIVGALNNDTVGWANDQRLDNTIRYSNAGIRDVQHGAAMQFSDLITYDALYYKSTDAAAYYEAYGDIVGGIGSYPVLASPHYHQSHDVLETINHRLVTEVAKTTAASLMLLASSPSRLTELKLQPSGNGVRATWKPAPEAGITGYIVAYGPPDNPEAQQIRVSNPEAVIAAVQPGTMVSVKAINARGLTGWDWARATVSGSSPETQRNTRR
jgi:hypothetical protein